MTDSFVDKEISIIIPCYNVDKYIEQCIHSLLMDVNFESFEVILVNDGSTDETWQKLRLLSSTHSNIEIYSQKNSGQSVARNYGMSLANGNFIGFIDADDWVSPNYFTKLIRKCKQEDLDIAICNIHTVHSNGSIDEMNTRPYKIDQFVHLYIDTIKERERVIELFLRDRISVSPCNRLYKRSFLIQNNIEFPIGLYNEDMEFSFDTLAAAKRIGKEEDSIYYYRQNPNSTTKIADVRILDMLLIVERIIAKVQRLVISTDNKAKYIFILNNSVYVTILRLISSTKLTRKIVIKDVSFKMKKIPTSYLLLNDDYKYKRKMLFIVIKYFPNIFLKYINHSWK